VGYYQVNDQLKKFSVSLSETPVSGAIVGQRLRAFAYSFPENVEGGGRLSGRRKAHGGPIEPDPVFHLLRRGKIRTSVVVCLSAMLLPELAESAGV
jgi:hypothetical protein